MTPRNVVPSTLPRNGVTVTDRWMDYASKHGPIEQPPFPLGIHSLGTIINYDLDDLVHEYCLIGSCCSTGLFVLINMNPRSNFEDSLSALQGCHYYGFPTHCTEVAESQSGLIPNGCDYY